MLTKKELRDFIVSYKKPRGFGRVAFPAIRRVFPNILANEIVSVQPMSLPTGLLFYLDHSYGLKTSGSLGNDKQDIDSSKT